MEQEVGNTIPKIDKDVVLGLQVLRKYIPRVLSGLNETEKYIRLTASFVGYVFHRNTQAGPEWCNTFKFTRETKRQSKTGKVSTGIGAVKFHIYYFNSTLRRGSKRGLTDS